MNDPESNRVRAALTQQFAETINRLILRIGALEESIEMLLPRIPEKNCSCHLHPPCSDCVDYGWLREIQSLLDDRSFLQVDK